MDSIRLRVDEGIASSQPIYQYSHNNPKWALLHGSKATWDVVNKEPSCNWTSRSGSATDGDTLG